MSSICLMVVFNHRYDQNIEKIKKLYQNRFSNIFLLIPFYDGPPVEGLNIIPVYESSFRFHGYIVTAYQRILQLRKNYQYYVIIGDDLILNPNVNETNILSYMNLQAGDSYISNLTPLNEANGVHPRRLWDGVLKPFKKYDGVEWEDKILPSQDAFKVYEDKMGRYSRKLKISWLISQVIFYGKNYKALYRLLLDLQCICLNRGLDLPYPLLKNYSDFLIISGEDMKDLCQMLGVFAAMGVFVEVAIPTAMVLVCSSIKCEKDIDKYGIAYWTDKDKEAIQQRYECSLKKLFENWDEKVIFYHPIKLSKWN